MVPGIYLSADELERAVAYRRFGYREICAHPKEVGILERDEALVIDFAHVLFDDAPAALMLALDNAERGVPVGIHTYDLANPRLAPLHGFTNVVFAKTHLRILARLRKLNLTRVSLGRAKNVRK